ncbi:MAG: signal peptidase II [Proteobacteria bacterium]|nr:signal peptidase II [Pseudomonadota bacterium]
MPLAGGLAVAVAVIDQISKAAILDMMQPPRMIEVTPFFNIVLGMNRGVSFGMFSADDPRAPYLLTGIAGAVVGLLVLWLWKSANRISATGIGLIIGGAVGNVIDRMRFGAVIDFLDFHLAGWHWPAFNAADAAICLGAAMIVAESLLSPAKKA